MFKRQALLSVVTIASLIFAPFSRSQSRENDQTKPNPETFPSVQVACSADKPVISQGETVLLRAWATSQSTQPPEYHWTADDGKIGDRDREVRWDLTTVPPSPRAYKASVRVMLQTGDSGSCSVEVIVEKKERGERETGRSFLVKGKSEVKGYGLYSYLLLGSRPIDSTHERYLRAIESYLAAIDEVTKLQDYFVRAKLNITYLPVEIQPAPNTNATWLLDHYNYAQARALLDTLPAKNLREGPYIVSVLKPLSSDAVPSQYLFQDHSTVPTDDKDLMTWWVREFLNQAAQERFWEPRTAELLALKIRTTIAVLATGLSQVQTSLGNLVVWRH